MVFSEIFHMFAWFNEIVADGQGEVSSFDIPLSEEHKKFNKNYLRLTREVEITIKEKSII